MSNHTIPHASCAQPTRAECHTPAWTLTCVGVTSKGTRTNPTDTVIPAEAGIQTRLREAQRPLSGILEIGTVACTRTVSDRRRDAMSNHTIPHAPCAQPARAECNTPIWTPTCVGVTSKGTRTNPTDTVIPAEAGIQTRLRGTQRPLALSGGLEIGTAA